MTYLNRRAPGSQPIKEQSPRSKEACVAAGQLCNFGGIWNLASGNQLPFVGNRLQGLKMETGRSMASGNRLPMVCNRLHRVTGHW